MMIWKIPCEMEIDFWQINLSVYYRNINREIAEQVVAIVEGLTK